MKKKFIRILTFIVGLYFFLEFFLPSEIGGDFDKQKVRSPAIVTDPKTSKTFLYYVGEYDMRNQAIGLAEVSSDATIKKYDKNPVLRSTMMNSFDRLGFSSLSIIRTSNEFLMFYIGYDLDRLPTICWASSSDGISWKKHGRMIFDEITPWRQIYEEERSYAGRYFGKLKSIAAGCNNNSTQLFIAYTEKGISKIGKAISVENNRWHFYPEAIPVNESKKLVDITNISCTSVPEGNELWIYFADGELFKLTDNGADSRMEKVIIEVTSSSLISNSKNLEIKIERQKPESLTIVSQEDEYRIFVSRKNEIIVTALFPLFKPVKMMNIPIHGIFSLKSKLGSIWDFDSSIFVIKSGNPSHSTYLSKGTTFASDSLGIIGAFAIGLGVVNLCMMHGKNLIKTRKQLHNSIIFFICLVTMFIFTLIGKPVYEEINAKKGTISPETSKIEQRKIAEEIEQGYSKTKLYSSKAYSFAYDFLLVNLGTTVFALISFYMVGAAFRSFRVKSFEALLLIISALIVLIGQIPIGAALSPVISDSGARLIPTLSQKLMMIVNAAAYRGVILGMTIGALSMSLRLWLGLERGMFHGTD